jgi:predicted aldo/keto reductase-like oxidoreductase
MGKGQVNLKLENGANLVRESIKSGINFIDTAESYGSYHYIREGKKGLSENVIIATKSGSVKEAEVSSAVENALKELEVEKIDIFHIHASREQDPFVRYSSALKCLIKHKLKGNIKHIGIATHIISAVEEAAERDEIDVIHPLINCSGLGILEGKKKLTAGSKVEAMLAAIKSAKQKNKGIYTMKPLGGGHLINSYEKSMKFLLDSKDIDSIAVGMVNTGELEVNVKYFEGGIYQGRPDVIKETNKKFIVLKFLCKGCGACMKACPNEAIQLVDKKSTIIHEKCILCGYCGLACPTFCIRIA